MKMVFG